jgi:hypothetical protein
MKRNVFIDEPDPTLPAARFRAVIWRGSAICTNAFDVSSYSFFSSCDTPQSYRSPPRAYTGTYCLSTGSPAFSSSLQSVSSGIHCSSRAGCLFELKGCMP